MSESVENQCRKCGTHLPPTETGPCPVCGDTGRTMVISVEEHMPTPTDSVSVSGTAQFNRSWDGQYHRMIRSFQNLWGVAPVTNSFVAADIEDGFINFFQNAWHLKDWLKNDPTTSAQVRDIEQHVNATPALKLVADVANGSKHLSLRTARTGDTSTNMNHMSFGGDPTQGLTGSIHVESGGTTFDAIQVARDGIAAWDSYLLSKGLAP